MSWFNEGYDKVKEEAAKSNFAEEFRLDDGETARMRFLTEDPFSFRQHNVALDGKYPKFTCRAGMGDGGCPLCEAGDKARFVGCFTIFDYRDEKVKSYIPGIRVLKVLDKLHALEGGLMARDFEVSRTGKGVDTQYVFIHQNPTPLPEKAKDPKTNELKLFDFAKIYAPKTVEELRGVAIRLGGAPQAPQTPAPGQPQAGQGFSTDGVKF